MHDGAPVRFVAFFVVFMYFPVVSSGVPVSQVARPFLKFVQISGCGCDRDAMYGGFAGAWSI